MRLVFLFLYLVAISLSAGAQTREYEVFLKGKQVGQLKVVREVNDESEKITVITLIDAQALVGLTQYDESQASYMDGKLIDATSITKINGSTATTQTTLRKGGYTINEDGKSKRLGQLMLFGSDLLYFEEPVGLERVYILALGKELNLHKRDNRNWSFEHNGSQHVYNYTGGVLTELQIENNSYKLTFRLKQ